MDDLPALVQALPAELYNEIYELTFTTGPDTHDIDANYKFPACLHISHSTRAQFSKTYYQNSTFYVSESIAIRWLERLPRSHRRQIREFRHELRYSIQDRSFKEDGPNMGALLRWMARDFERMDVTWDALKLKIWVDGVAKWMNYSQIQEELAAR